MIRSKLTTDLSVAGFENLFKELTALKKDVSKINDKFLAESLKYLKERAQYHISNSVGKTGYIPTGDLENSFSEIQVSFESGGLAILRNTAWHAAFTEFGTGLMGKMMPHELAAELGWVYDKNNHGEDGWWYWGDDGKRHWTQGMAAHRYMYNALRDYLYGGGKEECMRRAMNV